MIALHSFWSLATRVLPLKRPPFKRSAEPLAKNRAYFTKKLLPTPCFHEIFMTEYPDPGCSATIENLDMINNTYDRHKILELVPGGPKW
jgi:hypothetical protein